MSITRNLAATAVAEVAVCAVGLPIVAEEVHVTRINEGSAAFELGPDTAASDCDGWAEF
jgi:hypothetical protein